MIKEITGRNFILRMAQRDGRSKVLPTVDCLFT